MATPIDSDVIERRWGKSTLEDYELGVKIGEGAGGVVYKAMDKRDGKVYALKKIKTDKHDRDFILQEIEMLKRISRDGCSQYLTCLHDYIISDSSVIVILELFNGKELADFIGEIDLTNLQVLQLAYQLLQGLCELHSKGIAHRDLKLENILFNRRGFKISIIDLGLGCLLPCSYKIKIGTAPYFAPEYFVKPAMIDPKAVDMYTLGIVLYEMATGKPFLEFDPYTDGQKMKMQATKKYEFPFMVDLDKFDDGPVMELIAGLIGPDPATRYTCQEALRLIESTLKAKRSKKEKRKLEVYASKENRSLNLETLWGKD